MVEKLFPAVKRRSKLKLFSDFSVDKPTWIQTLKNKFSQVHKNFQVLDSRIRARGCKAVARMQRRKVAQHLSKLSKSQRVRLRRANAATKKRSLLKT